MSTNIPIQDLDPSTSPPSDRTIRAVVTLSWPYSSSTRQCALLLSERDFRLRARGGQIRVRFSGPAARAVAQAKLGISDEVVLELGGGEWASGSAVHVPGKSVGELHFGRGIRLRVQKEGANDVELDVAEDAVEEVEEEISQIEATPARKASPQTNFRSSIGTPGSPAIYSSPAYMRKAAKFSYLDGISRLFEDEWNNQDLPRKKARTSIGEVKSWRVVDRTPSPERPSPLAPAAVDEEMTDMVQEAVLEAETMVAEESPMGASAASPEARAAMQFIRSSPTPAAVQQDIETTSFTSASGPMSSPLELLATEALNGQQSINTQATAAPPVFPRVSVPPDSPTPQPKELEEPEHLIVDPTTPRLLPLPSTALPSTTPQISPIVPKGALPAETNDGYDEDAETSPQADLPSEGVLHRKAAILSPNKATENLLDQLRSTAGESELATEPIGPEHDDAVENTSQMEADDLAEEDAFSDDEAEDALSAHEHDDELMSEDDSEHVFDADEREGEEPSDDGTNEDPDMYRLPAQERSDEGKAEEAYNIEDQTDIKMGTASPGFTNDRAISQQPGFAPASSLLHATETPYKSTEQTLAAEEHPHVTPPRQPYFGLDGTLSTPGSAELTTPAAKPTGTPKSTPHSARDKVMKRTFHSLFGIKGTPSPEKEDLPMDDHTASTGQDDMQQSSPHAAESTAMPVEDISSDDAGIAPTGETSRHAGVEQLTTDASRLQDQQTQDDAEALEPRSVTPVVNDVPSEVPSAYQQEGVQTEMPHVERQGSPELIELDSSSAEEDEDEQIAHQIHMQTPVKPQNSAPVPQKRSAPQLPEPSTFEVLDVGPGDTATTTFDDAPSVKEPTTLDSNLSDAVKQDVQHEFSEIVQLSSVADQQARYEQLRGDAERSLKEELGTAAPDGVESRSEQLIPDSFEQPHAEPASVNSPEMIVERQVSVDIEPLEQIQSELLSDHVISGNDDVQMDHGTALQERIEQSQPSETHDDLEAKPTEATTEGPKTGQQDVEIIASAKEDDVEMLDDVRQDHESSQVSFQSQVLHDSMDTQRPVSLEHSSRPTSRDTVEEFSPMVLGSMPQPMADILNEENPTVRLQGLDTKNNVPVEKAAQEALQPSPMATFIDEDILGETPTRNAKIDRADIEASSLEQHTINPAKSMPIEQQEQQPTPQESIDDVRQSLVEEEQQVITAPDDPGNGDDLTKSDVQLLESQFQVTDMAEEQIVQPANAILPVSTEKIGYPNLKVGDGEGDNAHSTLPFSPSATQSAETEAQVSHANIVEAGAQPSHVTSQVHSSVQPHVDMDIGETSRDSANMSQPQSQERELASMPPPEQAPLPKTPARRSLRSRLSNVPDVISAWFSPKRSSIGAQEQEVTTEVETPARVEVQVTENTRTPRRRASGVSTAHAYFTSLASLGQHVNASSQQAGTIDVLAVVTDFTKEPERAKGGPKDYYTICRVTDTSMTSAKSVRVEVYRPWKAVLPAADVGDVILLRAFVVKSKKRQAYLLSTDASAWCVWRFAEHNRATARGKTEVEDGEAPVWARRASHGDVREEVNGPPVEYGLAEKEQARKLRNWWLETHGVDAAEKAAEGEGKEAAELIEL